MVGVSLNNSGKSDDKEQLVVADSGDVIVAVVPIKGDEVETMVTPNEGAVRRKQVSLLFGCLSALLMIGCLLVGTWLLINFLNRPNSMWRRTCRYRLKPTDPNADHRVFFDHGGLPAFDDGKNNLLPPQKPNKLPEFEQEVKVDLSKNTETIEVPQIGVTSNVRIIQDFDHNVTVIRDFGVNKCFIMPLDHQHVPTPANLMEALMAMMSGQFLPDNEVMRKTLKVQRPALTEVEVAKYGPIIGDSCNSGIPTYRLVPKTAEEQSRQRRSVKPSTYIYSVGHRAIMYDIDHAN